MRKNKIIEMSFNWLIEKGYVRENVEERWRKWIMEDLEWYYDNCLNEEVKKESEEKVMMEVVECWLDGGIGEEG